MTTIPRIRINGPLVPFVGRVWSHLLAQGYTPRSSKNLLRLVSHLSRWLVDAGLRLSDLTRERIQAFFGDRRRNKFLLERVTNTVILVLRTNIY